MVKSVSLDNAVVAQIEREAREEERPFSQIVNRRLRVAFGLGVRRGAGRGIPEVCRAVSGGGGISSGAGFAGGNSHNNGSSSSSANGSGHAAGVSVDVVDAERGAV